MSSLVRDIAPPSLRRDRPRVVVIGAGMAGLAAALRLQQAGAAVTVLERQGVPGGKLRALRSPAGPVDAGPTVLTLREVFEDLFRSAGARLEDHVPLVRLPVLARHFWPDGSRLDLFDDPDANAAAIRDFAGARAEAQFRAFAVRARDLFAAFDAPMMQAAAPEMRAMAAAIARSPRLLRAMAPGATLAGLLDREFDDPRLRQLFGRYATYQGGSPHESPALMALIWQAEAAGVWALPGGLHRLAGTLAALAEARGARFRYGADAERIEVGNGIVTAVRLDDAERIDADAVVFNGDPRALALGLLGPEVAGVAAVTSGMARSLSARVWAFAAEAGGADLCHHTLFFCADPAAEFDDLASGRAPRDPTIYVCAQDRGLGTPVPGTERFEVIVNAPPLTLHGGAQSEETTCRMQVFETLARRGLSLTPVPGAAAETGPEGFERLFPGSAGAIYGQSPHGLTAALRRPRARTSIGGLYLAGGGTHPGAGLPMAALSGRHAAEAIAKDLALT